MATAQSQFFLKFWSICQDSKTTLFSIYRKSSFLLHVTEELKVSLHLLFSAQLMFADFNTRGTASFGKKLQKFGLLVVR